MQMGGSAGALSVTRRTVAPDEQPAPAPSRRPPAAVLPEVAQVVSAPAELLPVEPVRRVRAPDTIARADLGTVLRAQYGAIETVLMMMFTRQRVVVELDSAIRLSIERISKHSFSVEQLQQIVFVFPDVFDIVYAPPRASGQRPQLAVRYTVGVQPNASAARRQEFALRLQAAIEKYGGALPLAPLPADPSAEVGTNPASVLAKLRAAGSLGGARPAAAPSSVMSTGSALVSTSVSGAVRAPDSAAVSAALRGVDPAILARVRERQAALVAASARAEREKLVVRAASIEQLCKAVWMYASRASARVRSRAMRASVYLRRAMAARCRAPRSRMRWSAATRRSASPLSSVRARARARGAGVPC